MTRDKIPVQDFDDFLAKKLRNSSPYIDDAGFTENVLRKLPDSSADARKGRRFWIIAGAVVACTAAPFVVATGMDIIQWVYQLDLSQLIQLGIISSSVTFGVALTWLVRELDWI
jgi:hypothetical protein